MVSQDTVNRLLKDEREALEAKFKPFVEKATALDKQEAERKKKEQADLPEIERLKAQVADLTSWKAKVEELETAFKEILDAKLAAIPDERRTLIPDGLPSTKLLAWIEKNSKVLYGTESIAAGAPGGGKLPIGTPDPQLAKAEEKVKMMFPRLVPGSDPFKAKVQSVLAQLKASVPPA